MANMCDNTLTLTVTSIPSWYKKDPEHSGISIPEEPRFLFLYEDFDSIQWSEEETPDGIQYTIILNFETKWAPPIDLYYKLLEDPTVVNFTARWFEPGCNILGYATKEAGLVDEDCPNVYYSEALDIDVMKDEPSDNYIEINGTDSWITFEEYKVQIKERCEKYPTTIAALASEELKDISAHFAQ